MLASSASQCARSSRRRNAGPDSRRRNHSARSRPVTTGMRAMRLLCRFGEWVQRQLAPPWFAPQPPGNPQPATWRRLRSSRPPPPSGGPPPGTGEPPLGAPSPGRPRPCGPAPGRSAEPCSNRAPGGTAGSAPGSGSHTTVPSAASASMLDAPTTWYWIPASSSAGSCGWPAGASTASADRPARPAS